MRAPALGGERTTLRLLVRADAPILAGYASDPLLRSVLALERSATRAEEEELIARLAECDDEVVFGIVAREGDRLIGVTGLRLCDPRQAQFGIFIGDPSERDKGIGAEVATLVVEYAFRELDLDRVWLRVYAENARAIRSYARVGFVKETEGASLVVMEIRRGAWAARRPASSSTADR